LENMRQNTIFKAVLSLNLLCRLFQAALIMAYLRE